MGPSVELALKRPGFFPAGAGLFHARIEPVKRLSVFDLSERGAIRGRRARAWLSKLPAAIAGRELAVVRDSLGWRGDECGIELVLHPTGPGNALVINEDDSHFFGTRSTEAMSVGGLQAFVDQYANTAVTHLFLCPNAMKASYRSRVWDAIWDLGDGQKPPREDFPKKWVEIPRLLHERGLDPYAVWIARCREKGISPWLSMHTARPART